MFNKLTQSIKKNILLIIELTLITIYSIICWELHFNIPVEYHYSFGIFMTVGVVGITYQFSKIEKKNENNKTGLTPKKKAGLQIKSETKTLTAEDTKDLMEAITNHPSPEEFDEAWFAEEEKEKTNNNIDCPTSIPIPTDEDIEFMSDYGVATGNETDKEYFFAEGYSSEKFDEAWSAVFKSNNEKTGD